MRGQREGKRRGEEIGREGVMYGKEMEEVDA